MPRLGNDNEAQRLDQIKSILDDAFPDLACLRCGSEIFHLTHVRPSGYLMADADQAKLTCGRCGKIELYDLTVLRDAKKPIDRQGRD